MTSTEIRKMWYDFFEKKGHKKMESAPLIPIDDDSLHIDVPVDNRMGYLRDLISKDEVERIIKKLRENGKLVRHGSDRGGYWEVIQ